MFKFRSLLALCVLPLALSGCEMGGSGVDASKIPTIVTVDVQKVHTESNAAKKAVKHLEEVQAVLQQGFKDLEEQSKTWEEETRQQEIRKGIVLLERHMGIERNKATNVVGRHMMAQIEAWAKDKPNTFVVPRQNLFAAPATADITATIISMMDGKDVTFDELPKVEIRSPEELAKMAEEAEKAEKEAKEAEEPAKVPAPKK